LGYSATRDKAGPTLDLSLSAA